MTNRLCSFGLLLLLFLSSCGFGNYYILCPAYAILDEKEAQPKAEMQSFSETSNKDCVEEGS